MTPRRWAWHRSVRKRWWTNLGDLLLSDQPIDRQMMMVDSGVNLGFRHSDDHGSGLRKRNLPLISIIEAMVLPLEHFWREMMVMGSAVAMPAKSVLTVVVVPDEGGSELRSHVVVVNDDRGRIRLRPAFSVKAAASLVNDRMED
ncbi:hypothetical protein L1987_23896 [Smallanthus sonchifolius]|uniref:Uncharacterized protein n=1 Tax=Smallanthus sonchifolius TaxID=185202 RepID=A0ACB9ILK8_9ASTR|nr:hypothetical protein L1987_23896 [Smallanthus sonchifolius]